MKNKNLDKIKNIFKSKLSLEQIKRVLYIWVYNWQGDGFLTNFMNLSLFEIYSIFKLENSNINKQTEMDQNSLLDFFSMCKEQDFNNIFLRLKDDYFVSINDFNI